MPVTRNTQYHPTEEERNAIKQLMATLTLDDKINIIRGDEEPKETDQGVAGYLPGVASKAIAGLRFADGPPVVQTRQPSPAPTSTMGLAATFDRKIAYDNGKAIGLEAVRLGVDVALEPFANILRDYRFGRGWNTYGEDPALTGAIGAE